MKRIGIKLYNEGLTDLLEGTKTWSFRNRKCLMNYLDIEVLGKRLMRFRERSYRIGITDFLNNIQNNPTFYNELTKIRDKLIKNEKDRA